MAGAQGVGSPVAWRWFQVADAGAALFVWRVVVAVVVIVIVVVVIVIVVTVVVKVAVVVANRRCEGDEFRVYIKFGPHQ